MELSKKHLVWFVPVILAVVGGYGLLMHNVASSGKVMAKEERFKYELEIYTLQQQIKTKEERPVITKTATTSIAPMIQRIRPQLDVAIINRIDKAVMKYSLMYKLPPEFVVCVMKRESNFNPLAKSRVGALGLMQVFPKWHRDKMQKMGIDTADVYHIDHNVRLGCWILREYLDRTGSVDKALRSYVGGKHPSYIRDILTMYVNEIMEVHKQ